jgi:ribosome-binding factor A
MTLRPGLHATRTPRRERVAEQLREEISALMLRDMKDPRIKLASITRVSVSADLREARVMVSALGNDEERQSVVEAMRHAEGFLRTQLGARLENLRSIPRLHFELDESVAYSIRINTVLRGIESGSEGTT